MSWRVTDGWATWQGDPVDLAAAIRAGTPAGVRANLVCADLIGADLRGSRLARADLTGAHLSAANLTRADLRDADLTGAVMLGACLAHADLGSAVLPSADLTRAVMLGADLRGADLTRANLTDADLTGGANLRNADLTGAVLSGTSGLVHASVGWSGHGDCGHTLLGVIVGGEPRLWCGDWSGTPDELRAYIAEEGEYISRPASRLRALEIVLELLAAGGAP